MMFDFDWKVYAALVLALSLMALPLVHRKFYGNVPEKNPNDLLQRDHNFTVIDLRPHKDFQASHIETAINIPYSRTDRCKQQIFELASDKHQNTPVVLVCDTDLISTKLAKAMIDKGLNNIFILKGGFNFWKRKRLPIVKD